MERKRRIKPKAKKYIEKADKLKGVSYKSLPTGIWCNTLKRARDFVEKLRERLGKASDDEVKKAAYDFVNHLKNTVYQQRYKWTPLSEEYLQWKRKKGRDTRILLATHEYIQSIRVIRNEVGSWHDETKVIYYEIGLPDIVHRDSGMPLRKLAAIHEFGVPKRNIPARPLWQPAMKEFSKSTSKKVLKRIKVRALKEAKILSKEIGRS